jgi:hypothetical protein
VDYVATGRLMHKQKKGLLAQAFLKV